MDYLAWALLIGASRLAVISMLLVAGGVKGVVGLAYSRSSSRKLGPWTPGKANNAAACAPLYRGSAIVSLLAAFCSGCGDWSGFGFDANGPELPRLGHALELKAGMVVADVGAGKGELTLALASEVGSSGRVFSTEIDPVRLARLRETVVRSQLGQVTVVEASSRTTGLPPGCCDAIVLRRVYHHLTDPASMNASLLQSLRPGGVLAVIDLPPPFSWHRGSLGISAHIVVDEVARSGFQPLQLISDWPGRGPFASYCAIFRKPRA
jgi:SAM-dependent methyltransferase